MSRIQTFPWVNLNCLCYNFRIRKCNILIPKQKKHGHIFFLNFGLFLIWLLNWRTLLKYGLRWTTYQMFSLQFWTHRVNIPIGIVPHTTVHRSYYYIRLLCVWQLTEEFTHTLSVDKTGFFRLELLTMLVRPYVVVHPSLHGYIKCCLCKDVYSCGIETPSATRGPLYITPCATR